MAREDIQTNLRIPAELKEWFEKKAAQERRSVTAQIVIALQQYREREVANAQPS